jgi:hypothetical protein
MVDLLREPKTLIPAENTCVLHMEKRNDILDQLLDVRRSVVEPGAGYSPPKIEFES